MGNIYASHQNRVMAKWREDISRNRELSIIMEYLLKQKRGEES